MNGKDNGTRQLDEQIDRLIDKRPHSKNILLAFKPMLLEKSRILAGLTLSDADTGSIDILRLKGGVPVIQQTRLFLKNDPWLDLALAIIPAIREGLPAMKHEVDGLEEALKSKKIDLFDYFDAPQDLAAAVVEGWEKEAGVSRNVSVLLLGMIGRIVLEKRAGHLIGFLKDKEWDKGYCPVCGSYPAVSIIHEKGAQRWLHCSDCGHEWRFSRVICPYCEHQAKQEGMNYFYVDGNDKEAAFICDTCKKYLITLNRLDNPGDNDPEVMAMGLSHLDALMQEKGFSPAKNCFWNRLS